MRSVAMKTTLLKLLFFHEYGIIKDLEIIYAHEDKHRYIQQRGWISMPQFIIARDLMRNIASPPCVNYPCP